MLFPIRLAFALFTLAILVNASNLSVENGFIHCPCSPDSSNGGHFFSSRIQQNLTASYSMLKVAESVNKMKAKELAKQILDNCQKMYVLDVCLANDKDLRKKNNKTLCIYDRVTGRNLDANAKPLLLCSKLNEGCVAAEHLVGLEVQHKTHLLRAVLCWRGFCATPNHGIFVYGRYTSLRKFCTLTYECTVQVRLVNNLRIFRRRRVQVTPEVAITPYDERFPWWTIWLVQSVQELISLIDFSQIKHLASKSTCS